MGVRTVFCLAVVLGDIALLIKKPPFGTQVYYCRQVSKWVC